MAVGDRATARLASQLALVLRVLEPPTRRRLARLRAFADEHGVEVLAAAAAARIRSSRCPVHRRRALGYALPEFGLWLPFAPTEFTQVNAGVNRVLVARARAPARPAPDERVADLFCGLGNFTLPLATRARRGHRRSRAPGRWSSGPRPNARAQRSRQRAAPIALSIPVADLFGLDEGPGRRSARSTRCLIDPPRDGALASCAQRCRDRAGSAPQRIVYVSCNPATLARDAGDAGP